MKKVLLFILLAAALAGQVYGQTTINVTTLSTAITTPAVNGVNAPSNAVTLASLGSGSTAVVVGQILFMDQEAMQVRALPASGTTVTVVRGVMATNPSTHAANVPVWYGNSQAFVSGQVGAYWRAGQCTANQQLYLPVIDVRNALIGSCDSASSRWAWQQLAPTKSDARNYHPVSNAAYTAQIWDEIVAYTSVTATRAVTLPSPTGLFGKVMIIKDESGSATATGTKTITLVGTVDGSSNPTAINTAYGVYRIYSNGVAWFTW